MSLDPESESESEPISSPESEWESDPESEQHHHDSAVRTPANDDLLMVVLVTTWFLFDSHILTELTNHIMAQIC